MSGSSHLAWGALLLDIRLRRLTDTAGRKTRLSPQECRVMARLLQACGAPVAGAQIARALYPAEDRSAATVQRMVPNVINRLRNRLRYLGRGLAIRQASGGRYALDDGTIQDEAGLSIGPLKLDVAEGRIWTEQGAAVSLGRQQSAVLEILMRRPGVTVPYAELLAGCHPLDGSPTVQRQRALVTVVIQLRRKLERLGAGGMVGTVSRRGYLIGIPADRAGARGSLQAA